MKEFYVTFTLYGIPPFYFFFPFLSPLSRRHARSLVVCVKAHVVHSFTAHSVPMSSTSVASTLP